jgi:hypothetical protein
MKQLRALWSDDVRYLVFAYWLVTARLRLRPWIGTCWVDQVAHAFARLLRQEESSGRLARIRNQGFVNPMGKLDFFCANRVLRRTLRCHWFLVPSRTRCHFVFFVAGDLLLGKHAGDLVARLFIMYFSCHLH